MSALIYCQHISKAYGVKRLFTAVTIGLKGSDRIGVVGPNGAGKSTLLKILAGLETVDDGTVSRRKHLRVAYVPQQSDFSYAKTVMEVVDTAARVGGVSEDVRLPRILETLGRIGFADGEERVEKLSGGWIKRLAIACGWVQEPDVMLLDEPTNHLDFDGLAWLESVLMQAPWPWVLVSHDRWLLDRATNKIAELNSRYPEGLLMVNGTYSEFLDARDALHETQTQQAQALAGKVRREVEWLHRGPKARTTKAKYRVDSAHALQAELAETSARLRQENTEIDFVGSGRQTKELIVAKDVSKTFGARTLFRNLDLVISPGIALGVLGHNGSGKSTLLKLLAKEIDADGGSVRHADRLQVIYFDQHREQLNPKETLRKTLSDTGHTVTYRGQSVHLAGWAKRFRFQPEQLDLPVELLSGGEQARAMIARLMLKPADVLIVDEPTNDLDIATREVLEESLQDFPGGLVLVTHDRYMLARVCTRFVGFDSQGGHGQFAEYEQWTHWLRRQEQGREQAKPTKLPERARPKRSSRNKLSYKERKEYGALEARILKAEEAVETCRATVADPVVATDHIKLQDAFDALTRAEHDVERLYARWAELESKLQDHP